MNETINFPMDECLNRISENPEIDNSTDIITLLGQNEFTHTKNIKKKNYRDESKIITPKFVKR